jgi:hypothetical protein
VTTGAGIRLAALQTLRFRAAGGAGLAGVHLQIQAGSGSNANTPPTRPGSSMAQ